MRFDGRRVLVVGLGASGRAAAEILAARGADVRVSEARAEVDGREELEALGIELALGGHDQRHLDDIDLVVASPGVPGDAPVLRWAVEAGLPVWSELELGARLCDAPYVAVTGTNGKTTTTEMVAAAMRAAGLDAVACGNIGHPFSRAAIEGHEALAVEASSFQLANIDTFRPRVSVLLNVAPDHLDWHGTTEAYAAAKGRIFVNQGEGDTHVGNADDPGAMLLSSAAPCPIVTFTLDEPDAGQVGYVEGALVSRLDDVDRLLGRPSADSAGFRADAAAAVAAALAFGIAPDAVARGVGSIEPLAHRGTIVAQVTVGERQVTFVDDSKATNPHATLASLEGRDGVVLIAGGLSKGVDLSPLVSAAPHLAAVVAIGEAAPELLRLFADVVPVQRADSMDDAVAAATDAARRTGADVVLLAPACASQDMFVDYRERGERFAEAALRETEGARG